MKRLKRQEVQSSLLETLFSDVGDTAHSYLDWLLLLFLQLHAAAAAFPALVLIFVWHPALDLTPFAVPPLLQGSLSNSAASALGPTQVRSICVRFGRQKRNRSYFFLQQCRHSRRLIATSNILLQITTPMQQVDMRPQEFL